MAKESPRQQEIVGRVMHEFKHKKLETRGRKVRNPRQAIAIGLSEAGASRNKSGAQNKRSQSRTVAKERKGQTAQQQKEGRGALRKAPARKTPARKAAPRASTSRARGDGMTRAALYAEARKRGIKGVSRYSKADLERALKGSRKRA